MATPLISVIMPAYNHEKFVGAAIESVLNQTIDDFEFIIIDDGSTDGTAEIARSYVDGRIHFYTQSNQDAFNTLNRGLKLARGQYISIINSDDIYINDRLEILLGVVRAVGAQCAFTGVTAIGEQGQEIADITHPWNQWYSRLRVHFSSSPSLYHGFLKGNILVSTSNLFFLRSVPEAVGFFSSRRFLHDYDYIFRIITAFESGTLFLADRALLKYRIHANNTLLQGEIEARHEDCALIRRSLYARIPSDLHSYLDIAIPRLLELGDELNAIRARNR